jgi:hypothetical protein
MIVTLAILGLALHAAETQFGKWSKVYLLKSGGDTVAELRVQAGASARSGATAALGSRDWTRKSGALMETVRVVLKIGMGTNWVTVSADDIVTAPEAK